MKKFSNLSDQKSSISFNKQKSKNLSTDIDSLNSQISKELEGTKLEGEWEIVNIIDVSLDIPTNEAIIINAELGVSLLRGVIRFI